MFIRDEISNIILTVYETGRSGIIIKPLEIADSILSLQDIGIISDDQSLPKYCPNPVWKRFSVTDVQQDMVKHGWRRIS